LETVHGLAGLILFLRLITNNSKDSSGTFRKMTILARKVPALFIALALIPPISASAWFLFSSAQAQNDAVTGTPARNSQNMALLSSRVAMASDLKADTDAVITIDDEQALMPEIGPVGTLADVSDGPGADAIIIYTVVPGDSVADIAKRFGVSENTVRWANNLKAGQPIHVDDTLVILPFDGLKYTVKSGDTIDSIANRFKLSKEEKADFLDFNGITSTSLLAAGDVVVIPGAEPVVAVATPKKTIPRGNAHVNTGAYTPNKTTSGIIKNYFIVPVTGAGCRYSQRKHDTYAVDLACPIGTPVKAAADGTVLFARYGNNGGYGNLIIIKHPNGTTTFYAHLRAEGILVSQGQSVPQGQVIGYVGSTGRSTGPHLHFEVRGAGNPGFDTTGSSWKQL
jgi:murein DD-endopeptidase MepM/ murein hydrolase activator NlpD